MCSNRKLKDQEKKKLNTLLLQLAPIYLNSMLFNLQEISNHGISTFTFQYLRPLEYFVD